LVASSANLGSLTLASLAVSLAENIQAQTNNELPITANKGSSLYLVTISLSAPNINHPCSPAFKIDWLKVLSQTLSAP
jgi:desulfoferrodoxin (superoxide reductase-like protein)